jgi:transposase
MQMKIKILTLTKSEQGELTLGFRTGESHCFRMRCRAVLLKSEGLSSARVGEQTEMTAQSVNGWVKRFETEGIKGLYTRPGQGRKPIMDCSDEEAVRKAIESDRQSVRSAKEAWQKASGKEAGDLTFRRFLSALAQDTDV